LKTELVVSSLTQEHEAMTTVIPLASRKAAPYSSTMDTTDPETIRLHVQAENALCTALHELRRLDATPTTLRLATNRAIRAATLLKRASECANSGKVQRHV
jgi:hypothetical protein